jgi:hypothetical protein
MLKQDSISEKQAIWQKIMWGSIFIVGGGSFREDVSYIQFTDMSAPSFRMQTNKKNGSECSRCGMLPGLCWN